MRVWTVVEGETFEGYATRWLCVEGERVADLGGPEHPTLDFAQFIVDACNAAEERAVLGTGKLEMWQRKGEGDWVLLGEADVTDVSVRIGDVDRQ